MNLIKDWRKGLKLYTTKLHLFGMGLTGLSTGLALVYGSMDTIQHSIIATWVTYLIFFFIFLGAFLARFIKQ